MSVTPRAAGDSTGSWWQMECPYPPTHCRCWVTALWAALVQPFWGTGRFPSCYRHPKCQRLLGGFRIPQGATVRRFVERPCSKMGGIEVVTGREGAMGRMGAPWGVPAVPPAHAGSRGGSFTNRIHPPPRTKIQMTAPGRAGFC